MVRYLEQDSGAVAGVLLEARAATVLEVDENRKRIIQNLMVALAVDVCECADAACIVLEFGTVEALCGRIVCLHRFLPHWYRFAKPAENRH